MDRAPGDPPAWSWNPWLNQCRQYRANLAHERQRVPLRVLEARHPQLVVGHLRYQMGFAEELGTPALDLLVGRLDVLNLVVEDRAGMVEPVLGQRDHQADAAAVEEGQLRGELEEEPHPEHVAVEG